jgi:photosystem II stability/assembly factor-like uncharacterized protein
VTALLVLADSSVVAARVDVAGPLTVTLFSSVDGGGKWTASSLPATVVRRPLLASDPRKANLALFGGAERGGLMNSTDGGATWHYVGAFTGTADPIALSGGVSYSGTLGVSSGLLFKSTDAWDTWTDVTPAAFGSQMLAALAIDPVDSAGATAVRGDGSLYRTSDGGRTWTKLPGAIYSYQALLACDPLRSKRLFAGTQDGLWRSSSGGE